MSRPEATSDGAQRVRAVVERAMATGPGLRALDVERTLRALAQAARGVADPDTALGAHARDALVASTGLTASMVDWALATNVAPDDLDASLRRLAAGLAWPASEHDVLVAPPRLAVTILAGNVFTAALRAVAVPLLCGAPVVVKASSRDDVFPRLLKRALAAADAEVAPALEVLTFPGGPGPLEDALLAEADVVSVYGADATVRSIRARASPTTRVVGHGHGLGVVYVEAAALPSIDHAHQVAEEIALDVAAFDQRGCLSPHAVWVQRGGAVDGLGLAHLLADHGLARLADTLPRGALPTDAASAQLQWRGVAAARGTLLERDGYAVSHEGDAALRVSPGWRNVAVHDAEHVDDFAARVQPLGAHLKAVGVAGSVDARRQVARTLRPTLAPRISPVGRMQTPGLGSLADGALPWADVARFIQVD